MHTVTYLQHEHIQRLLGRLSVDKSPCYQSEFKHSDRVIRLIASKIRDAYVFIAQNYEAGDEICLFG